MRRARPAGGKDSPMGIGRLRFADWDSLVEDLRFMFLDGDFLIEFYQRGVCDRGFDHRLELWVPDCASEITVPPVLGLPCEIGFPLS